MGFQFHEQGAPVIDEASCTNCLRCAENCPTETLAVEDGRVRIARRNFMGCIGCGQCMMVCAEKAIRVTGRRIDPSDLVDLPPARASFEGLDALLVGRRSVRRFAPAPVSSDDLRRVLGAASSAPMGIPPTEVGVVVFSQRDAVHAFAEDVVACFRQTDRSLGPVMLALMRPFLGAEDHRALKEFVKPLFAKIVEAWDDGQDVLFYEAPAAIVFHRGPGADPADVGIACTYAMLAAHALGLGTCMIGTLSVLDRFPAIRRKIGAPEGHRVGLGLVLGHPAVSWERGIRRKWASERWV